jgi:hypothetical protein
MTFSWPVDRTSNPLPELGDNPTDAEQAAYDAAVVARNAAEDIAVFVMWALSARQFGGEPVRIRPGPRVGFPLSVWVHARWAALWEDWSPWEPIGCGCVTRCSWASPTVIHLPGPVYPPSDDDPIVVTIAGDVLDPSEWVLEGDLLYRRGGKVWPGQNLARPLGEPGTWSVDYQRGVPLPAGVARLTGLLAKEIQLAQAGEKCRLPSSLVATVRRGASHKFDPAAVSKKTGITDIDQWLAAVNPNGLMCAPEVL